MQTTFNDDSISSVLTALKKANDAFTGAHPGLSEDRQPVHTVYGGAQLFKSTTAGRIGQLGLKSLEQFAPDAESLATAFGLNLSPEMAQKLYSRVREKLEREAVEDFRIDFEDGFGYRPDDEEDAAAANTAMEVAKGMKDGGLPPFIGIRIKCFSEELKRRSIRTLDIFISTLVQASGGKLPGGFVVTIPKITAPAQITALVSLFEILEKNNNLESGCLKLEFMVETPQSILSVDGKAALREFLDASAGRCVAAHFGTYDYTASMSITAHYQQMDHQACDFARSFMQVALADTGIWLSDGATNVMPVAAKDASAQQARETVHRAWKLAFDHTRHSLSNGIYQGWDLHPAQLVARYTAVYSFFLEGLDAATERLRNFIQVAAKATLTGDIFDDAATGQGLLNYFSRALNCGAITEAEITATGLTIEQVRGGSFKAIVESL